MSDTLRPVLVAAGLVLLAFLVWRISVVLLLAFGAVLLATLLRLLAGFILRHARLPDKAAYACAIVLVLAAVLAAAWLFGAQAKAQIGMLAEALPRALASLQGWLDAQPWLRPLMPSLAEGNIAKHVGSVALTTVDVAIGVLMLVFGGVYFGAEPRLYRDGLLQLVPEQQQRRAAEALDVCAYAIRRWLLGQLLDMAAVGALTGIGLWLIGAPSALALGLLTAAAAFVPYAGAIAAGALAVLVAWGESMELALWTLGVYVLVQQIEGHLLMPFVQRWAIALPPGLAVFAVVGTGYVFGPLGVLFATPLAVVLYVLVKKLYVGDTLGRKVNIER